jgi:UDP-N-acetylmuramyl pentapeptide phosphotransferase/UDP-N-acetylglucosamine-1-phosphate transferase
MGWAELSAAFIVTTGVCWAVIRTPLAQRVLDRPNDRSLHDTPTPRAGGVAIWFGLAAAGLAAWLVPAGGAASGTPWPASLAVAFTVLAALGIADDRRGLPTSVRLVIQAATVVAYVVASGLAPRVLTVFGLPLVLGVFAVPITAIGALWTLNLYNFMDGMDGFAGAMTVVGFSTLSWLAWTAGQDGLAAVAAWPAAAALGFLTLNLPPARIFLGDSGSVPLGFLVSAVSLWGLAAGVWSPVLPVIVFAPFVFDATVTLLRRIASGEVAWQAHRTHVYQRLVLAGFGRRRTLAVEVGFMMLAAVGACVARTGGRGIEALALAVAIAAYAALFALADRLERQQRQGAAPVSRN